jgi:hypothetical protein
MKVSICPGCTLFCVLQAYCVTWLPVPRCRPMVALLPLLVTVPYTMSNFDWFSYSRISKFT